MLPASLLSCKRREGGAIVPDYLGPHDYPWLRALVDEYTRFAGRPVRQLHQRLKEPLSPDAGEKRKQRAIRVLDRLCQQRVDMPVKPVTLRQEVFDAAADAPQATADRIYDRAAAQLGIAAELARSGLFADLPGERRVSRPDASLDPVRLALEANLALAQSLVRRATEVRLELCGRARDVIRLAQLQGLIVAVESAAIEREADPRREPGVADSSGATIDGTDAVVAVSGPLSLFRRTTVYGHALASLIPGLAWCNRFRLEARCVIDDQTIRIELRSGDPIFPSAEPRRFDSQLEERFAGDFARIAPDWDIIREPEPVHAGRSLVFPDFALQHRRDPGRRWLLEIVGFWTEDYLDRKLASMRAARLDNLILCVDATRDCADGALPADARVVPFRRRIAPADVLRIVEPSA